MKKHIFILIFLFNYSQTNDNFCIAQNQKDKYIGLKRFNTTQEFKKECSGVMIFKYKKDACRVFTMKDMKFNVYIKDKYTISYFKIGEEKRVCGKEIKEYIKD